MSIWASIEGKLKVNNMKLARDIAAKSIPKPLPEYPNIKVIDNQYFKGSEGGCRFWVSEPDILWIEGNLRDCELVDPIRTAFLTLVKEVSGQGFIDVFIVGNRWILEFYDGILTENFTFNPNRTFNLKSEVKNNG